MPPEGASWAPGHAAVGSFPRVLAAAACCVPAIVTRMVLPRRAGLFVAQDIMLMISFMYISQPQSPRNYLQNDARNLRRTIFLFLRGS